MAQKVQDKKIQKAPVGKGGDKGQKTDQGQKKGDGKKK